MNKIEKAYTILMNRLPYKYHIPIKIYETIYTVLKAQTKHSGRTYKYLVNYYNEYLKNPKKATYIKNKYWGNDVFKRKVRQKVFEIVALGGNPITIAKHNIVYCSIKEICFVLLHEIAHNAIRSSTEKDCDEFAIRWSRKLIKERLFDL